MEFLSFGWIGSWIQGYASQCAISDQEDEVVFHLIWTVSKTHTSAVR